MPLPVTGTPQLLELLADFVPDDFLNQTLPGTRPGGRHRDWSPAQLFRTSLLQLLTPARSFNLLCRLLPTQRAWRRFAHLPQAWRTPNVRQLHEFRARLSPQLLRAVNAHLLRPLLRDWPTELPGIGLMDATDLPAATQEYKKRLAVDSRPTGLRWAGGPRKPGKVRGSSATRSTPFGCGCPSTSKPCCWFR